MRFDRWGWLVVVLAGCRSKEPSTVTLSSDAPSAVLKQEEAPVALNADSPVTYPEALATQRLGGTVLLRLYIDSTGIVVKESTTVQESSGYPALDSAAVIGAPRLQFAPALRDGIPVAALFLQPITFRAGSSGAAPP